MTQQEQVAAQIEAAFVKAEQVYGRKFDRCKVSLDIKSGSSKAGEARVLPFRQIRINRGLLNQNPSHVLGVTCPHEVAHIVAFDLYGKEGWGHGPRWKSVMTSIGLKPDRCHTLVTRSITNKPVYECSGCKKQSILSRATHHKVEFKGTILRKCRHCGGDFVHVGKARDLIKNNQLTCRELPENTK